MAAAAANESAHAWWAEYERSALLAGRNSRAVATLMLALIVVGAAGNVLSLLIYAHRLMRAPITVLLLGLSAIDLSLVLLAVPVFVLYHLLDWPSDLHKLSYHAYVSKVLYPLNMVAQTASVFTVLLIAFERWLAVCYPFKAHIVISERRSRLGLVIVVCLAFLYNSVRFWEYEVVVKQAGNVTYTAPEKLLRDYIKQRVYMYGYYTAGYLIILFLIPTALLAFFHYQIISETVRSRRTRHFLSRQERQEQRMALMMTTIVAIFVACNSLAFALNFAEAAYPRFFRDPSTLVLAYALNDTSNLLIVLNASCNCPIYYALSEKYRLLLRHLLCRRALPHSAQAATQMSVLRRRSDNTSASVSFGRGARDSSAGSLAVAPVGRHTSDRLLPVAVALPQRSASVAHAIDCLDKPRES